MLIVLTTFILKVLSSCYINQAALEVDGTSRAEVVRIPSLGKPSIYHEVSSFCHASSLSDSLAVCYTLSKPLTYAKTFHRRKLSVENLALIQSITLKQIKPLICDNKCNFIADYKQKFQIYCLTDIGFTSQSAKQQVQHLYQIWKGNRIYRN